MADESSELMLVLDCIEGKINDFMLYAGERGDDEDVDVDSTPKTIFPIPSLFRQTDPRLYKPTLLSIGPYHRGKLHLKALDNEKTKSMVSLVYPDYTSRLADCVKAVMNLESKARSCYEDTEIFRLPSSRADLVQLLVMDGYFIIDLFYRFFLLDSKPELWGGRRPLMVWTDLLKLENQIPFFVLEALFELLLFPSIMNKEWLQRLSQMGSNRALRYLAVMYLTDAGPEFRIPLSRDPRSISEVHHLLHLYYLCLTPHTQEEEEESNWTLRYSLALAESLNLSPYILMAMIFSPHRLLRCIFMKLKASAFFSRRPPSLPKLRPSISIPCATQLQEDGVKFVKKRKCTSLCDVTFSRRRAIMRIPQLSIHSDSVALFANLIHYEQRRCKDQKKYWRLGTSEHEETYMTSYVFLMDCLVKSPRDAAVLRESEIIVSEQDDKKVAEFFNKISGLCDVTAGADYCYARLSDEVKEYRKFKLLRWRAYFTMLRWHRWRAYFAQLKRDYFGSPWALISFLAALILLCLSMLQTFFTIYPYYHPR